MATEQQRKEIRLALDQIEHLETQLKLANSRLDMLLAQSSHTSEVKISPEQAKTFLRLANAQHRGKAPDPKSLTQRVLVEIKRSPGPVAISALATLLNVTPKQARNAVVYHQKKGTVVHAGAPEQFILKGRMLNENGAQAEAK
jgi:hypothetical protein